MKRAGGNYGASVIQCKPVGGIARPAVEGRGLARVPFSVAPGVAIGSDLGRPVAGESVLMLTGDASRIGSPEGGFPERNPYRRTVLCAVNFAGASPIRQVVVAAPA